MSRSRKKVPGVSDSEGYKNKRFYLRLMNRRIRRLDTSGEDGWIPKGNHYRRFVSRWDFRDYNFRYFSMKALKKSWFGQNRIYRAWMK
jgi:hypothetical protein